ncbi:MAG TPA: zinc metallopeptidase [Planctomycetes bacterium]|nr:zinc metallopeptidase [Planctomycetota bacterium]
MLWFLTDPLYLVVTLVGLGLSLWAQAKVKSSFRAFERVPVRSGMSGAEAAAAVVRAGGAGGIRIERHKGFLTDHYDPRSRTLRLSPAVYDGRSVSAVAVAAHEAGHAIQDATAYPLLQFRTKMVAATNIGNRLWAIPFLFGLMLSGAVSRGAGATSGWSGGQILMAIGILLFGLVVLFQLVTLPVEIDASRRAKSVLASAGIVTSQEEAVGVSKVLDAAAWTYVAAAAAGVLQLLYMIMRFQQSDRR